MAHLDPNSTKSVMTTVDLQLYRTIRDIVTSKTSPMVTNCCYATGARYSRRETRLRETMYSFIHDTLYLAMYDEIPF